MQPASVAARNVASSSNAVMNMTGRLEPDAVNCRRNSMPEMPPKLISKIRQAAFLAFSPFRNASADANAWVQKPCALNKRTIPFSILGSSSTTAIIFLVLFKEETNSTLKQFRTPIIPSNILYFRVVSLGRQTAVLEEKRQDSS